MQHLLIHLLIHYLIFLAKHTSDPFLITDFKFLGNKIFDLL